MLRYVLAAVVALALVGVALPAIDRAGVQASEDALAREARRLADATDRLAATTDPGGRRLVTVRLPERSAARADVRYLWVDPVTDTVRWTVGGRERQLRLDADLVRGATLRESGRHRLALRHVERCGRPALVVREFKPEEPATRSYAVRAVP